MKFNNKGYMLVEIILASVIAFSISVYIINLVVKLKNKNDDVFVDSQVMTDQAIVTNKLMDYAVKEQEEFKCENLRVDGNKIYYTPVGETEEVLIDIINDKATVKEFDKYNDCSNKFGKIDINIELEVPQMAEKDYNITVDYKYKIGDMDPPQFTLTIPSNDGNVWKQSNTGEIKISDNTTLLNTEYHVRYGWSTSAPYNCNNLTNETTVLIDSKDNNGFVYGVSDILISGTMTGDGKLYACNLEDISDAADHSIAAGTIISVVMKLDNAAPTVSFSRNGSAISWNCSDVGSGLDASGALNTSGNALTLSGTSDMTASHTCTDNAGNAQSGSKTYTYSTCASGDPEACASGCDICPGSCAGTRTECLKWECRYAVDPGAGSGGCYGAGCITQRCDVCTSYREYCNRYNPDYECRCSDCHHRVNTCVAGFIG